MNLFVITLILFLATNKGSLVVAKDNIRKNGLESSGQMVDRAVEQNPIPSSKLLTGEQEAMPCTNNCKTWYDGCNTCGCSNKVEWCTKMFCSNPNKEVYCLEYMNSHDSEDSEDSNKIQEKRKHRKKLLTHSAGGISPSSSRNLDDVGSFRFFFLRDGHCAKGWMGNNIRVNSVEDCAATCNDREECAYFAYDVDSFNCATYYQDGCPDDGGYPKFRSYWLERNFIETDTYKHPGHCASGWMGDNRIVGTYNDCVTLCREREGCRYISYDDSNSYATNCATYWFSGRCLDDDLFPEFDSYLIGWYPYYDFFHNGICASGWMGDNKKVDSIDDCAAICFDRNECEYFAYDASNSYDTNCATYFTYDDCLQGNSFWEYITYRIDRWAE